MEKRNHITVTVSGAPGTGKSTLAKILGHQLGLVYGRDNVRISDPDGSKRPKTVTEAYETADAASGGTSIVVVVEQAKRDA